MTDSTHPLREIAARLGNGRTALVGVDPDSSHPAFALWAPGRPVPLSVAGGGSSDRPDVPVSLSAFCEFLRGCGEVAGLAVETQPFWGPMTSPQSMMGVYRARFYAEAACELLHIPVIEAPPTTWQAAFLRGEHRCRAKGDAKRAYQAKVNRLWPGIAKNEDARAALAILWWLAREVGTEIPAEG